MQVTPPQGAPQGAPQAAPGGQQKQGSAEQAIQMIQMGFKQLGQMIQSAGPKVDPQDIKLFQAALQATDNFIQSIMGAPQEEQGEAPPGKPAPSQPMPANANAGARPAPQY